MSMNLDDDNDDIEIVEAEEQDIISGSSTVKRRKLTSNVWDDFIRVKDLFGKDKARCKHCKNVEYISASSHRTSNMKRHVLRCPKKNTGDINQLILSQSSNNGALGAKQSIYDHGTFREFMAKCIVQHNYPFIWFEHSGLRDLLKYLNHDFKTISRNTAKADVIKLYNKEKRKVQKLLELTPGRISLTSDTWISITTEGYICITAHFIDKEWKLHKKVLSFKYLPPPHTGVALCDEMLTRLSAWKIESKLFSVTLDNCTANDVLVQSFKTQLSLKDALLLEGEFFHVRCCAHILNLIVQDGLKELDASVDKVRECVKYIKGSQSRKKKFVESIQQVGVESKKGLRLDIPTRWNSTYLMLSHALIYKNAFSHMQLRDSNVEPPTREEWRKIEKIYLVLEVFKDVTDTFSGTKYPTANLYFHEVWKIQMCLKEAVESSDTCVYAMAARMQGKFDKYWKEFNVLLAIAVVLDPRYKLSFVEYCFTKLYGSDAQNRVHLVQLRLHTLYNEYSTHSVEASNTNLYVSSPTSESHGSGSSSLQDFVEYLSKKNSHLGNKSELQLYLDERCVDHSESMDILMYWKSSQYRFPSVAAMARDVLAVPISTVASESTFSVGGQVIDKYRSSHSSDNAEALICTRDWLFGSKDLLEMDDDIDAILEVDIYNNDSLELND